MILKQFKNIIVLPFIIMIKLYQWVLSPVLKTNCRYFPTCSIYALESLKEHGLIKGLYLSIKRISNCHPFGGHGYDPVPKKMKERI
jgi:hypothetical protein